MKIATSELKGKLLDWAVAKVMGYELVSLNPLETLFTRNGWQPTTDQAQGGTILDQYDISVWVTLNGLGDRGKWSACLPDWFRADPTENTHPEAMYGCTRLEAGMRALVRDKLGAEVDVPDELIRTLPAPDEEGLED